MNREVPQQEQDTTFLAELIVLIYHDPEVNKTYGYHRMTLHLNLWGIACSKNKVLRIIRILGIQAEIRKECKVYSTVNPDHVSENAQPVIHSHRGYQYTSYMYQELNEKYRFTQSMSRAGYYIYNQPIERFFGTLKAKYYYRKTFSSTGQLEQGINQYIDFYNWRRATLTFEGFSPMIFRKEYQIAT